MEGRPEEGADRRGAMHYATTSGTESRIFFPAGKAMSEARRQIIDCSWKRFSTDIEPAFLGGISPSVSVIGKSSTSASVGGEERGFRAARPWGDNNDNGP